MLLRLLMISCLIVWLESYLASGVQAQQQRRQPPRAAVNLEAELPRIPPTEPEQAVSTFQLQPGFKIELVASEPLLRDPVAMDFDADGRLFVVEFPEYNQKHVHTEIKDRGRVRVLDDTNGDGVYDRSTVYVDNLSYPTAVACFDGGVFVAAAPEILFCKDTDGDDQADMRRVVFTGFGQEFQRAGQAQLNSFRWGLDNRIHVCTNFSGGAILRPDSEDSQPLNVRNRGFRFDPRTLDYEAASGGGQHGLGIDDWGREFRCRNSDPVRMLVYDERYLARNAYLNAPPPAVSILETGKHTQLFRISRDEPWRVLRTRMRTEGLYPGSNEGGRPFGFFTSATGITIYRGDAWPDQYRGTGFVGEVANNLIFRARFEPAGVALSARRADAGAEFVASTDNWFRPVQFDNGPDGALYVVDMYRELIEGAGFLPPELASRINVTGGVDRGRIYRIIPADFQHRPAPRLSTATTAELVSLLAHRNGWHRDTAARLIYTRQDAAAVPPLKNLARNSESAVGRLHALYALQGLAALDETTLASLLGDAHPRVREHALRLAEQHVEHWPSARQGILDAVADDDISVRFQTAFSLGSFGGSARDAALMQLAKREGADAWFRLAILASTGNQQGSMLEVMLSDPQFRGSNHGRRLLDELAGQIGAAADTGALRALSRAIERLPAGEAELARSLARRTALSGSSSLVAKTLSAQGGRAAEMMAQIRVAARRQSVDPELRSAVRVQAIRLLGLLDFDEAQPLVRQLLDVRQPPAIQQATVQLLGESARPEVASLLLQRWPTFSPQVRAAVIETLCLRDAWLTALLDAIKHQAIQRGEIDPARIQILTSHPNQAIRQQARQLFAQAQLANNRQEVVTEYQPALRLDGDPARGKESFRRVCSACHRLAGVGVAVGADLRAIRNRGSATILSNILDPNRDVKPQYLTYLVVTKDGRAQTGMIESESANSMSIRRPDNTSITVLRTDIDELHGTGLSFMPEGLEKQLDQQAMADLLAYLSSIK